MYFSFDVTARNQVALNLMALQFRTVYCFTCKLKSCAMWRPRRFLSNHFNSIFSSNKFNLMLFQILFWFFFIVCKRKMSMIFFLFCFWIKKPLLTRRMRCRKNKWKKNSGKHAYIYTPLTYSIPYIYRKYIKHPAAKTEEKITKQFNYSYWIRRHTLTLYSVAGWLTRCQHIIFISV